MRHMGQTHIWDGQTDTHVGRTDRHTYGTDRHTCGTDRHTLDSLKNIYAKTFLFVHQLLPKYFCQLPQCQGSP